MIFLMHDIFLTAKATKEMIEKKRNSKAYKM